MTLSAFFLRISGLDAEKTLRNGPIKPFAFFGKQR